MTDEFNKSFYTILSFIMISKNKIESRNLIKFLFYDKLSTSKFKLRNPIRVLVIELDSLENKGRNNQLFISYYDNQY